MGLFGLHKCDGGRFLANEGSRVSIFDVGGGFLGSSRPPRKDGALRIEGVSSDCRAMMVVTWPVPSPPDGVVESVTATFSWEDLETAIRTPFVRLSWGQVVGRIINEYRQGFAFPWARKAQWTVSGDRVYVGTSDDFEIQVFDREKGLVEVIRWQGEPLLITSADRALYARKREEFLAAFPENAPFFPKLADVHVPVRKPAHSTLAVDDEGNVWVQEPTESAVGMEWMLGEGRGRHDDSPVRWTVFDPSGRLLGVVEIPADLRVYAIQNDHIIAVWKDDLDVEHVRLYRLNKG